MPASRSITLALAASLAAAVAGCATPVGPVNEQNWGAPDRHAWYRASQGSRLLPYAWLTALEDDGGAPFLRAETVARYRYLPADPGENTPLPIGFAIDTNRHGARLTETDLRWYRGQDGHAPWVGMNCAACHTAELSVDGKPLRVDGGPTMADFAGFTDALRAALRATAADAARFDRFAAKVLAARDTPGNRTLLQAALATHIKRLDTIAGLAQPDPDDPEYGPGRLDAVGHILATVAYLAKAPGQFGAPSGAPVSYPFLWNVPQHRLLQWDGIAPNQPIKVRGRSIIDAGALVRNTSEVVGVFADVGIVPGGGGKLAGYPSSIDVRNLAAMESQLARLKPPPWPAGAPFDPALATTGKALFGRHCAECHNPLARDDLASPAGDVMTPIWGPRGVGTDPWMACNAFAFRARTGRLAGVQPTYIAAKPGTEMGPVAETRSMLTATSIGALAGKKRQIVEAALAGLFDRNQRPTVITPQIQSEQEDKPSRLKECKNAWANADAPGRELLAYKGRPLTGIWATGPYLHNGSVRTLWELLLDPAKRSASFTVGSRALDTRDVGYADEAVQGGWTFRTRDAAGRPISGNDNRGHDYGNARFTDAERRALVEYMKSL